jgi:apolipoprotein N-acyltransferase
MQDAVAKAGYPGEEASTKLSAPGAPRSLTNWGLTTLTALLLVLSFPDFNLWPLAWVGLVPLLWLIAQQRKRWRPFIFGWATGIVLFYGSCYWLTYPLIHFARLSRWQSYLVLLPAAVVVALFPAFFALAQAQLIRRWGTGLVLAAPLLWATFEWARMTITGQLWNAIGYSQAFHPSLIQAARFGSVYAVGFLIVTVNAAIAFALLKRTARTTARAGMVIALVAMVIFSLNATAYSTGAGRPVAAVVAVQPNVPMEPIGSVGEMQLLTNRHLSMSEDALAKLNSNDLPRLVIWPESPMNFNYSRDSEFRDLITQFTQKNHTSVIFNSQEPAPNNGYYNSALLVNEVGRLNAQYDKIRLMPFGEYNPLPQWFPGSNNVRAIVGEFTPGANYTLMPLGDQRAGVFICIESAYPSVARTLTANGADVLVNISNDGYLGPTAVMHQHLSNVIFRAVENGRPLLRVTNTGITAYVAPNGEVRDATQSFQPVVRTWTITAAPSGKTFYVKQGDLFVIICAVVSLFALGLSFARRKAGTGYRVSGTGKSTDT